VIFVSSEKVPLRVEDNLLRDDNYRKHSINDFKKPPRFSERFEVWRKLSQQRTYPSGERIFFVMIFV
jgi:hypothetical protein